MKKSDKEERFENIKKDIINQLEAINYKGIHIDDIGNEIGLAISKYVNSKDADNEGISLYDFICGLEHGLTDKKETSVTTEQFKKVYNDIDRKTSLLNETKAIHERLIRNIKKLKELGINILKES